MVRPGRRLTLLVSLAAVATLLVLVWVPIAVLIGLALLLLFAAAWWEYQAVQRALAAIEVARAMPTVVGRGLSFPVTLQITNGSSLACSGEVRDVTPDACQPQWAVERFQLGPSARAEVVRSYRIDRRGEHHFGPVWIRLQGPWRLIDLQKSFDCGGALRVLPETFASREELVKDLGAAVQMLDKIALTREHGNGTEFESLHPFRLGDDPRRIDWRTTARHRMPIVRRYQVERHRDVVILVDCGRLMGAETDRGSKLDCAVDGALNLARVALHGGDRCGMGMFDDRVRGFLKPVSGIASLRALAECVYDLQTEWRESDFTRMFAELQARQSKRSLVVVLSDINDVETSRQFRSALVRLGMRHLVLFAALRTPLLNRVIHQEVSTLLDGARKAVTFRLLRERQQSLHALRRSGVHIVDVEPQQLTLPLVNQFIDLRRRNLL